MVPGVPEVRKLVIGLTGGIATGKTTVLKELARLGADAFSTDDIAHDVLKRGGPAYRGVVRRFGRDVLAPSGEIDRKALGRVVFGDRARLRVLERLTHPYIRRAWLARARSSPGPVTVVDVPLLFEKGLEKHFDLTYLVYADPRTQARRLRSRDGLGAREAARRIALQWPTDRKARLADVVLDNRRPPAALKRTLREHAAAFRLLAAAGSPSHPKVKGR